MEEQRRHSGMAGREANTKAVAESTARKILHFQEHGLFLGTVKTDAMFFKMQNFAYRDNLRIFPKIN